MRKKKQVTAEEIPAQEKILLLEGFNLNIKYSPPGNNYKSDFSIPFVKALHYTLNKKLEAYIIKIDIKNTLEYFAAMACRGGDISAWCQSITGYHVKSIQEDCGKYTASWSGSILSRQRKYISPLQEELLEIDVLETSPEDNISK